MASNPGMHNMLSQAQLGALANTINTGGGFSVKAAGPGVGTSASDSYMVGIAGQQVDHPPNVPLAVSDMDKFVSDRAGMLAEPGVYMGGYQATDPVRASLDVSESFPRTEEGLRSARFATAASNQESLGEVDPQGGYVGSIDNPFYNYSAGQDAPRDMVTLFEGDWAATGNVDPVAVDVVTAGPNWPRVSGRRRRR